MLADLIDELSRLSWPGAIGLSVLILCIAWVAVELIRRFRR